jgi:hypothetical protein
MPTLIVQKGHCYRKTGATGTTGEQEFATRVADAAVRLLHGRRGWTVKPILADEPSSDYEGDAFAAIHCDGSTNSSAHGASVGYQNNEGRALALAWKRAYAARGWNRGFRDDNYTSALAGYYGVRTARSVGNTRAFIIESGFLTNPQDRALLTGAGGPERVALALGDALGITTPEEDDMTPKELMDAKFGGHDWYTVLDAYQDDPGSLGHYFKGLGEHVYAIRTFVDTVEATQAALIKSLNETRAQLAEVQAQLAQLQPDPPQG